MKFHYFCGMYKSIRYVRVVISLIAMAVPTWALLAGYESVFVRMQILTALLTGVAVCLIFWALVTLVYGRIYCSTVCPLGTLMDCVAAGGRLVGLPLLRTLYPHSPRIPHHSASHLCERLGIPAHSPRPLQRLRTHGRRACGAPLGQGVERGGIHGVGPVGGCPYSHRGGAGVVAPRTVDMQQCMPRGHGARRRLATLLLPHRDRPRPLHKLRRVRARVQGSVYQAAREDGRHLALRGVLQLHKCMPQSGNKL